MSAGAKNPFEHEASAAPQKIASGLSRIGLAMRHQSWRAAGLRGLTPTQGQLLATLASSGQAQRLSELTERLALTAATVSEAVRVLAEKGLIRKDRDPLDARAVSIVLTERGSDEANRAMHWSDFLASAIETLQGDEQGVMLRVLSKMIRELQLRGEIPVQRMCVTCRHFKPNVYDDEVNPHHCGLVDAPFGDSQLRIDCPEQDPAEDELAQSNWVEFISRHGG
jgi:DNA-binding MarR family transcriptional regulator